MMTRYLVPRIPSIEWLDYDWDKEIHQIKNKTMLFAPSPTRGPARATAESNLKTGWWVLADQTQTLPEGF